MARAKGHPQELAPYLTQHSADPDWPLVVIVDGQGRSLHGCADCGAEIPDGVLVERVDGKVVAYSPTVAPAEQPEMLTSSRGEVYHHTPAVEVSRTVVHDCEGPRG